MNIFYIENCPEISHFHAILQFTQYNLYSYVRATQEILQYLSMQLSNGYVSDQGEILCST